MLNKRFYKRSPSKVNSSFNYKTNLTRVAINQGPRIDLRTGSTPHMATSGVVQECILENKGRGGASFFARICHCTATVHSPLCNQLAALSILSVTPVWIFHQARSVYSFADIHQWFLRPYTLWLPPWHLPEVTFRLPSPDLGLLFSVQRKDCPCLRGLAPDGPASDKLALAKGLCHLPLWGLNLCPCSCWLLTHPEGSSGWKLQHFVLQENWWNRSLHWYFQEPISCAQSLHLLMSRKALNPFKVTSAPCD